MAVVIMSLVKRVVSCPPRTTQELTPTTPGVNGGSTYQLATLLSLSLETWTWRRRTASLTIWRFWKDRMGQKMVSCFISWCLHNMLFSQPLSSNSLVVTRSSVWVKQYMKTRCFQRWRMVQLLVLWGHCLLSSGLSCLINGKCESFLEAFLHFSTRRTQSLLLNITLKDILKAALDFKRLCSNRFPKPLVVKTASNWYIGWANVAVWGWNRML